MGVCKKSNEFWSQLLKLHLTLKLVAVNGVWTVILALAFDIAEQVPLFCLLPIIQ